MNDSESSFASHLVAKFGRLEHFRTDLHTKISHIYKM